MTGTATKIGTVTQMGITSYIDLIYTDHLGTEHIERCSTKSGYLIRVDELEAEGYIVIG